VGCRWPSPGLGTLVRSERKDTESRNDSRLVSAVWSFAALILSFNPSASLRAADIFSWISAWDDMVLKRIYQTWAMWR
jgi:hypothetical protein